MPGHDKESEVEANTDNKEPNPANGHRNGQKLMSASKLREWVRLEIPGFEDDEPLKQIARLLGFKRTPGDPNGRRRYFSTIQAYREIRANGKDRDETLALMSP